MMTDAQRQRWDQFVASPKAAAFRPLLKQASQIVALIQSLPCVDLDDGLHVSWDTGHEFIQFEIDTDGGAEWFWQKGHTMWSSEVGEPGAVFEDLIEKITNSRVGGSNPEDEG